MVISFGAQIRKTIIFLWSPTPPTPAHSARKTESLQSPLFEAIGGRGTRGSVAYIAIFRDVAVAEANTVLRVEINENSTDEPWPRVNGLFEVVNCTAGTRALGASRVSTSTGCAGRLTACAKSAPMQ